MLRIRFTCVQIFLFNTASQRTVYATTGETIATHRVSHRPIKRQSRSWSKRAMIYTKLNRSHSLLEHNMYMSALLLRNWMWVLGNNNPGRSVLLSIYVIRRFLMGHFDIARCHSL